MTTVEPRHTTPAKRTKPATFAKIAKAKKATERHTSTHAAPGAVDLGDKPLAARVTKHDRILTLLSRRDGTTIAEMMETTGWQQHSVRGFLAGTVKKKLGFTLTSSKTAGEPRRYRVDTKRGR